MSTLDREIRLRLSVQHALLGAVSSALAAVTCGWNGNEIVLEFLVDSDFNDEDRERMEVVASEVVADFGDEAITTIFTSLPSEGPKIPVAKRWWAYKRFQPNAMSVDRKLEWPIVVQILALVDRLFQEKASWPELIKQIRGAADVDILTAGKIALSHNGWRRLCNYRINHDPECKKQASRHMKIHGPSSLISSIGGRFAVAGPELN
ncbi:hypothetical protein [Rhizobium lusitanum]|uniref:Uncharacterized protein n=3 Tax=Rhizobium lusitanum TaxID=293958 RepID=A0A1C3XMD2_9HYPH|nr:hypothetical protein [Rhizobium lusitanum]SCB53379.1 hypothetical protein GA0061101_1783 [Rhizobium lusitanum]